MSCKIAQVFMIDDLMNFVFVNVNLRAAIGNYLVNWQKVFSAYLTADYYSNSNLF